jgi:hypothetical protein
VCACVCVCTYNIVSVCTLICWVCAITEVCLCMAVWLKAAAAAGRTHTHTHTCAHTHTYTLEHKHTPKHKHTPIHTIKHKHTHTPATSQQGRSILSTASANPHLLRGYALAANPPPKAPSTQPSSQQQQQQPGSGPPISRPTARPSTAPPTCATPPSTTHLPANGRSLMQSITGACSCVSPSLNHRCVQLCALEAEQQGGALCV